jgi:hypothetical protein
MVAIAELASPFDRTLSARPGFDEASRFICRFTDSYNRMPCLIGLWSRMDRGEWLRLLGEWWTCCDNIGSYRRDLRWRLPKTGPVPELMTAEEIEAYNALPERLTIYRGCGLDNIHGASWSLERDIAARFPFLIRYRQDQPLLVTAKVLKSRILAVKLERKEAEVITFAASRAEVEELQAPPLLGTASQEVG